ncbi:hypothetical protein MNBD_UNCLBAC01-1867 [hydrothermal vent metagenome]|uniref:Uncharacterized protein n=1 Tax=hydrothermal vent metagenome TaxID=652676 RepID=A0A3B1DKZ3_9ZZZZ
MLENRHDEDVLLTKIKNKRQELEDYLAKNEPRHSRLINASIILGALTAALTAGPGVGGKEFIDGIKNIVSFGIPIWQLLCLVASILSVAAVIVNGILKSQNLTAKITNARSCASKLEGLETLLELQQMDVKQATSLYTQYISEVYHT